LLRIPLGSLVKKIHSENFLNIAKKYFLADIDKPIVETKTSFENENAIVIEKSSSEAMIEGPPLTLPSLKNEKETFQIEFGTDVSHQQKRIFWEPMNTSKVLNPNIAIIGTMGTGKTQFTKSLVTQLIKNQKANVDELPIGILIFDYKADYVKDDFVAATNANVLNLHKLPFNPLALFGNKPMLPVHIASQFQATIAQAFSLGQKQQQRIRSLIIETYEESGIIRSDPKTWLKPAPTLKDVWVAYNNQDKIEHDSLHAALAQLIDFEIFEPDRMKAQSLYDVIQGVTVINLSGYDQNVQNLVVALTLDLFYTQMHQKGSSTIEGSNRQLTKFVLVDEADNFMKQEFPGLRKLLKEGREFGVGTILSTQELTHFKTTNNNYSSYILSWVIHRVPSITPQAVKSLFNTASKNDIEDLITVIHSLEKHKSIYVDGEKKLNKIQDLPFWKLVEDFK
jgi:DNA phosphorothioation-dependent restriction protein DptH